MHQVGLELTKLAANVAKITILAASLVNIAILAASLANALANASLAAKRNLATSRCRQEPWARSFGRTRV